MTAPFERAIIGARDAGVAQLAERHLPKVDVASSNLVSRSTRHSSLSSSDMTDVDPWRFSETWQVRQYELDQFGHVNNAVYLNWVEQVATDHVEALGFGRDWALVHAGGWVVREHHVTYHRPALFGDVVTITTLPQSLAGVRGLRRTEIHHAVDGTLLTEVLTEWVWVRAVDGRPTRVPAELLRIFRRA
jgi:acyl-CoA thioester hydrolase